MAGYVEAAEAYFRAPVERASLAELADRYRGLNARAVLLAWDAETATGRPRVPNETVAAAYPGLTVIAAHFGWPWHLELIAMALHKTNIYIDISGWSPRRIPPELIHELRGRLSDQFVWGSDYPFISPERCLSELGALSLPGDVLQKVLYANAAQILGLSEP